MRLRIETVLSGPMAVVELHGQLFAAGVHEFERVCSEMSLPFVVDLTHLLSCDADGVLALRLQRQRGAQLAGMSPYIALLLESRDRALAEREAASGTPRNRDAVGAPDPTSPANPTRRQK
jgi:hypothetical protein